MADCLSLPIPQQDHTTDTGKTIHPGTHQSQQKPIKSKHQPVKTKHKSFQRVQSSSVPESHPDDSPKATPLPGGTPNYLQVGDEATTSKERKRRNRRYVDTAYSRLASYKASLADTIQIKPSNKEITKFIEAALALLTTEKKKIGGLFTNENKLLQRVDAALSKLANQIEDHISSQEENQDGTALALLEEITRLKISRGSLGSATDRGLYPDGEYDNYEPDRGRESRILTDRWFANDKASRPGGQKSLDASLWEKSMPVNSSVTYLYKLLEKQKHTDQMGFIQAMRLLSRPDVREVENAYIYHPQNQQKKKTLREAIIKRYGLPHPTKAPRSQYLFELLDRGGKATNTTRLAVTLGLMERGTWAKFVTDESEVVRLVELADPKELQQLWSHYRDTLSNNLNTYNFRRIENFAKGNLYYASIKDTAKSLKKEKDKLDELKKDATENKEAIEKSEAKKAAEEEELGNWQREVLEKSKDKGGKDVYPFLDYKDRQLAAIIKNFSAGANKYTGRWWYSLPKTTGYVKDLAKEIESWLKTVQKEEKTYFNKVPVIRKYIAGQPVSFTPLGSNSQPIEIAPPHGTTHYLRAIGEGNFTVFGNHIRQLNKSKKHPILGKMGAGALSFIGGIFALIQHPVALVSNVLTLGRYSMVLTKDQQQWRRAGKIGWNSGDRKFLRYMVEAGTVREGDQKPDDTDTRNEYRFPGGESNRETYEKADIENDSSREQIEVEENTEAKIIVKNVRKLIQTRGTEFEPEMLASLVNIARQADILLHTKRYNPATVFDPNRYKINRRADLIKSIMKLPNRWRVQFLDAFLPKAEAIEKSESPKQVEERVNTALNKVRKVLIALDMRPKQIYELLGSLKYGADVGATYHQLRRYAGKDTFSAHKVLQLAHLLNPKELEIAQTDTEMHIGLERQFAKHRFSRWNLAWRKKRTEYLKKFNELCHLLKINPQLDWSEEALKKDNTGKSTYRQIKKITSKNTEKSGTKTSHQQELEQKEGSYKRYYWDHVSSDNLEIQEEKETRDKQQNELDSLPENQKVTDRQYADKVKQFARKFANLVKNTNDYNKMLQIALDIWQEGDQYELPLYLFTKKNPYTGGNNRKTAFLYEVYHEMLADDSLKDAAAKFKKKTDFGGPVRGGKGMSVRFVDRLESGNLDIIGEILKGNYKWFRPASDRDKSYGRSSFERLGGRVLLEEWTNIAENKQFLKQRAKTKEQIRAARKAETPDQDQIEQLQEKYKILDEKIKNSCIPMPRRDRLDQLRKTYTNNGSYVEVVKSLLLHLSTSTEFDKSFVDAMIAEGYRAEDLMTLTEVYKFLAAQEMEKFLTGGKWTVQWKALTVKSTERKEGAARLISAMRELDQARDEGKTHGDLGDNKGYFYDTYFDDVDERQEAYIKQAAKYRKNLGKALWMLSTAAFIPFGAGIGGLSAFVSKLVVSAFFTGQGMAITLLNSALDPYKHSVGGMLGETAWSGLKGAMLSGVMLGSFELKNIFENMSWFGTESIDGLEGDHIDRDASFFDRFTGNQGERWELLGKKAGEYGMRKVYKEIGKEMIRGIDKAVREGPKAGLINFRDVFNRAFIVEMATKTILKISLSDGVTGAAPALDKLFGAPDKDKKDYTDKDYSDDFRGSEMRRNVRRKIYETMGFKYATKVLEYAISNQNPAFRPFFEKYDVKRKSPTAQDTVEQLKYAQDAEDALFEAQLKIAEIEEQLPSDERPRFPFLQDLVDRVSENTPDKLKELATTLQGVVGNQLNYVLDILRGFQQEASTPPHKITLTTPEKETSTLARTKQNFDAEHLKELGSQGNPPGGLQIPATIPRTSSQRDSSYEQQNSKLQSNHSISKSRTTRNGIQNEGNSCYLGAGLNMLAFSGYYDTFNNLRGNALGAMIYGILTDVRAGKPIKAARIKTLRSMLTQVQIETVSRTTGRRTRDRILTDYQRYSQEDPTEIIGKIFDYLRVAGLTQTSELTKANGEVTHTNQQEAFLNLPIQNADSLQQAMQEYSRSEVVKEVDYQDQKTQRTRKGDAQKKILLGDGHPQAITFALKRFRSDDYGRTAKETKAVNMPERVVLNGYVYRLDAVVFHLGNSPKGGHYTAKTRNTDGNGWKYRDDSIVSDTQGYDSPNVDNPGYMYTYTKERVVSPNDGGIFDLKTYQ